MGFSRVPVSWADPGMRQLPDEPEAEDGGRFAHSPATVYDGGDVPDEDTIGDLNQIMVRMTRWFT